MSPKISIVVVVTLLAAACCTAFVSPTPSVPSFVPLTAKNGEFDSDPVSTFQPLDLSTSSNRLTIRRPKNVFAVAAVAAAAVASSPLAAFADAAADAEGDYEYGAVDAPVGIAWAAGVLAILTALLPVFLKGGEEAFEEMKERDSGSFGKNSDVLGKRK